MTEKLKLDLSLILPDALHESDACVGRLTELLQPERLTTVHKVREDRTIRFCLYYDPQRLSASRVRIGGMLEASARYGTERLRLEYESEESDARRSSGASGHSVMPCLRKAPRSGWFAEAELQPQMILASRGPWL